MKKEIVLSLEKIDEEYKNARIERFKKGYPIKFRRTRTREKFKSDTLVEFLVRITPPAEDILSGKAFSELFREKQKNP
ncbi:hypothetical protein [Aquifex aeolicus]|uniref:hypothetical protein n=1 Tax=Aquifex aeolicus TaxID=63363 RepID=UPI0002F5C4ED|nr:hypothetical protein [Aquifex aeolicus]